MGVCSTVILSRYCNNAIYMNYLVFNTKLNEKRNRMDKGFPPGGDHGSEEIVGYGKGY